MYMKRFTTLPLIGLFFSAVLSIRGQDVPSSILQLKPDTLSADFLNRTLEEVPQSVTLLDQEEIQETNAQHLEELVGIIPGLTATAGSSRARFLQIRGIGEFDVYEEPQIPAVGFTIDGVEYHGLAVLGFLSDLKQVEVFKGPQSGRYGSSALAGSVNLVTNEPSKIFNGKAQLGFSQRNGIDYALALGGPIGENNQAWTYRLSFNRKQTDGYMENAHLNRKDTNNIEENAFIGKVRWQPNDMSELQFFSHYFDINNGYDAFSVNNNGVNTSDQPGKDFYDVHTIGVGGIAKAPDEFDVRFKTYFSNVKTKNSFDADWQAFTNKNREAYDRDKDSYQMEGTITDEGKSEAQWAVGAKYRISSETSHHYEEYTGISANDSQDINDRNNFYEDRNITLFGEFSRPLKQSLVLSGSLRIENRNFDFKDKDRGSTNSYAGVPETKLSLSEILWGGNLSLQYSANQKQFYFVNLSRGYRGSGFNTDPAVRSNGNAEKFKDESLINLEFGYRSDFKGKGSAYITLFAQKREDAQIREFSNSTFDFKTLNADQAYAYGAELALKYSLTEALQINSSLALLQSRIRHTDIPVLKNNRDQAASPVYQWSQRVRYHFAEYYSIQGVAKFIGEHFYDVYYDQKSPAYQIFDFDLGYQKGAWALSLYLKNAFDERYFTRAFSFSQVAPSSDGDYYDGIKSSEPFFGQRGLPRTLGIRIRYSF